MEIERKFLVDFLPDNWDKHPSKSIKQWYICQMPTIRIRQIDEQRFLTVKSKGHVVRLEHELPILQEEEWQNLLNIVQSSAIHKQRYYLPLSPTLTAELDVFLSPEHKGLQLVEVEFNNEAEAKCFEPPLWFGKEVSYDPNYKNNNLVNWKNS